MAKINYIWFLFIISITYVCGAALWEKSPDTGGRIVGGRVTTIEHYPYQISLRRKSAPTNAFSHTCGGSIYSERIIITAAHCVYARPAADYIVVAGTSSRAGSEGSAARLDKIVVHEKYNSNPTTNDIALLFLSTPLPLNGRTMAPIELAIENPNHGEISTITGWGTTTEGGVSSNILLAVDVPIVDNTRCNEAYDGLISDDMLCAGISGIGGKDACQGDSGGPLVVNGNLAGIVSWGYGCARPDYPGVYANVYYFLDWIEQQIK